MGDHRSDSSDSRYHDAPADDGSDGSVPVDKIVGRALFIIWPIDHVTRLGVPERTFEDVPAPSRDTPEPGRRQPRRARSARARAGSSAPAGAVAAATAASS